MLIALMLIPKGNAEIENAVVNPTNGDIAITYYSNENAEIVLMVFDTSGNVLISEGHSSNGGTHSKIVFLDENIYIYVSRAGKSYGYNRDGEQITPLSYDEWENIETKEWEGWDSQNGQKSYSYGNYRYYYNTTAYPESLCSWECDISIENTATNETVKLLSRRNE